MLQKETIIDIYTRFKNGDSHYLSIPEFCFVIEKLKSDDSIISNYISFNPFYKHRDFMVEIDERILYLERRNIIKETDIEEFYENEIIKEEGYEAYNIDLRKRSFLIHNDDKEAFIKILDKFVSYLDILIPYILQRLKNEFSLKEKDLLFGNICFETHYG